MAKTVPVTADELKAATAAVEEMDGTLGRLHGRIEKSILETNIGVQEALDYAARIGSLARTATDLTMLLIARARMDINAHQLEDKIRQRMAEEKA